MDTNMTFRIDSDIKAQMAAICAKLGMTPSTAFNVFANAFVREKGMPFEVKIQDEGKIITKGQMLADTNMKHLLTIAGSDSSGGAGIQADLKTFAAHGTFGMSVITAVTAQNTCGVTQVQNIDCDIVKAQIEAVFDDIRVDAVKIGMVSQPEIIETIAACLRKYAPKIIVVDPVMISKSGYPLLAPEACATLIRELLPLATLLTPNLPEAEAITGMKVTQESEMRAVAEKIIALGAKAVLVKGGHLSDTADDLLFDGAQETWFPGKRIDTKNTHGTGCTLSSSLATNLAKGLSLTEAVAASKAYVTEAIEHSLDIGGGCGPTHHFVDLYRKAGMLD